MRHLLPCCLLLAAACDAPGTTKVDFRRVKPTGLPAGTWTYEVIGKVQARFTLKVTYPIP